MGLYFSKIPKIYFVDSSSRDGRALEFRHLARGSNSCVAFVPEFLHTRLKDCQCITHPSMTSRLYVNKSLSLVNRPEFISTIRVSLCQSLFRYCYKTHRRTQARLPHTYIEPTRVHTRTYTHARTHTHVQTNSCYTSQLATSCSPCCLNHHIHSTHYLSGPSGQRQPNWAAAAQLGTSYQHTSTEHITGKLL